jgi:hypothetical protein
MPRILDFNFRETYRSINNLKPNLDAPDENIPAFIGGDYEDYPWLRVQGLRGGSLYVSCAMNGNMSAEPLIKYLASQPKPRRLAIVCGRHGRECGNQLAAHDSQSLHLDAWDGDGNGGVDAETLNSAAAALNKNPADVGRIVSFKDPDAFPDGGQSAVHLKAFAQKCFEDGEDVIFNWCYSLSAMHDAVYTGAIQELTNLGLAAATLISQDIAFANTPLSWFKAGYNFPNGEAHTAMPPFPWRDVSVDGDTPPSRTVLTDEFSKLQDVTIVSLIEKAKAWLATKGIVKNSKLENTAHILLLGNPQLVQTPVGGYFLVSDVLNKRVPGMVVPTPRVGSNYNPKAPTLSPGLLAGENSGALPKYVHHLAIGMGFFNQLMGQVVDGDIHLNAHMPGYSLAPWHEILHTFEGETLSASFFLNEGSVEVYASQFANHAGAPVAKWYSPYRKNCDAALKLISRFGDDYAKAYFADDLEARKKIWQAFQAADVGQHKYSLSAAEQAVVVQDVAWLQAPQPPAH